MHVLHARLNRVTTLLATLSFILPVFAALFAVAPASVSAADPAQGGTAKISGGQTVHGTRTATLPQLTPAQEQQLAAAVKNSNLPGPAIAEGAGAKHLTGAPTIAEQKAPPKQLPANGTNGVLPRAASDFSIYQNTAFTAGGLRSTTDEPSVASHGNVVFATGNWWAAVSTDFGQTWTYINPFTFYPSANGGFCCDQGIIYDPGRDVWVWQLQYIKDAAGNTIRLATTDTPGVLSNTWTFYDVNAQQMGQAAGVWIDYPNMALSSNYFYYTGNLFCNTCTSSSGGTAIRLALSDLHARPGGGISYQFHFGNFTMVPTQGATSTMYLTAQQDTTHIRITTWPEVNPLPISDTDVAHASYNTGVHNCVTPDTFDPCARDDNRVKTAWVAHGVIGVLWDVGQGSGGLGSFPFPFVQGMNANAGTLGFINDIALWGTFAAFGFPGAGVNARGAVGLNEFWGGGSYYPGSIVYISDEFNGYSWPGDYIYTRFGTNSPSAANRWGDFLTARPDGGNGNNWIGVGFTLQGPCAGGGVACANVEMRYLHWGRERDNPFAGQQALPAIFRNVGGTGVFYERNSLNSGNPTTVGVFGAGTDQPLMCDFDGNGTKTPVIFRNGAFYWSTSYDGSVFGGGVGFGSPGDIGVCGDWTGSGHQGIGIFRNGAFYLSNSATSPAVNFAIGFGSPGDIPVVGDWDHNGTETIGIFRNGAFYLSNSNTSPSVAYGFGFGAPGDIPLVGDWDRNGTTTVGIYRGGGWYLSNTLPATSVDIVFGYGGASGDKPLIWR